MRTRADIRGVAPHQKESRLQSLTYYIEFLHNRYSTYFPIIIIANNLTTNYKRISLSFLELRGAGALQSPFCSAAIKHS